MFYVLDENHNLIEAYDKEGVLAILEKAIADGSLSGITENSAFVTKLKCCVGGDTHPIAFITQAKYNELKASGSLIENCLYYITDDTTAEDIDAQLKSLTETLGKITDGTQIVPIAYKAQRDAENNVIVQTYAKIEDLKSGDIVPEFSRTARFLFPQVLMSSGNSISITESGTYVVAMTLTSGGNTTCYTDLIVIGDLDMPCISLNYLSTASPYAIYTHGTHKLTTGTSATLVYAYKIASTEN